MEKNCDFCVQSKNRERSCTKCEPNYEHFEPVENWEPNQGQSACNDRLGCHPALITWHKQLVKCAEKHDVEYLIGLPGDHRDGWQEGNTVEQEVQQQIEEAKSNT